MRAVILAGGFGSRLSEETQLKPKPMVEIGGKPILWHIMNIFSAHGIREFVVALGYKAEVVKTYFLNFYALNSDISIDLSTGDTDIRNGRQPNWKVHLVDTGLHTQTGGRLKRLRSWLGEDESFLFTYGDGLTDLDIGALVRFHDAHKLLATVTTVRSPARFGRLALHGDQVTEFYEKPEFSEGWINGGYFVLDRKVLDYISGDETIWERDPVERLARDGQLNGFRHYGFWSCMDTLKERNMLDELWAAGKAPWKIWDYGTRAQSEEAAALQSLGAAIGNGQLE
jgi:glucose-1-phosphate cytidylyltransferase